MISSCQICLAQDNTAKQLFQMNRARNGPFLRRSRSPIYWMKHHRAKQIAYRSLPKDLSQPPACISARRTSLTPPLYNDIQIVNHVIRFDSEILPEFFTKLTLPGQAIPSRRLSKITFDLVFLLKYLEKFWPNFQKIPNLNLVSSGESKIMFNA